MNRREILNLGVSAAANGSLRMGGLTLLGGGISRLLVPSPLAMAVESNTSSPASPNTLVVVFMRGAVDGLSMLAPYTESAYYQDRPNTSISPPATDITVSRGRDKNDSLIAMDDRFGLHPSLASLKKLYDGQDLAFIHAIGSPAPTRSHFDGQDQMEAGTMSVGRVSGGWLNRALVASASARSASASRFFRGVALSASMPRILSGEAESISLSAINDLRLNKKSPFSVGLHALYEQEGVLHDAGLRALQAVDTLQSQIDRKYAPENGATYTKKTTQFRELARLLKAGLGIEAVVIDFGGWDTHAGQGAAKGKLSSKLQVLAHGLSNFHKDMGEANKKVTVVTISEFGRTVAQNGSGGTDHGHGTVMMAMGGGVKGGKIYGRWPGIEPEQRYQGRDLAVTTDYRQFLSELIASRWGLQGSHRIFPNYRPAKEPLGMFG